MVTDSDKNLQWMLKLAGEKLAEEQNIGSIKGSAHKLHINLLNYKGENSTLLWRRIADTVLNR